MMPDMETRAEPSVGGNAGSDSGGAATQVIVGGPKAAHTGWLFYLIDNNNHQVSDTKVAYVSGERPNAGRIDFGSTRFGGSTNGYVENAVISWSPAEPFTTSGGGNGTRIKQDILTGKKNLQIVDDYFPSFTEQYVSKEPGDELYLIFEPFYWGQMYNGNTNQPTGRYLCATAYGWAYYQNRFGYGEYGCKWINRYTNNIYPNCVKLQNPQFNFAPLSGRLANSQILKTTIPYAGNGFMTFWAADDTTTLPSDTTQGMVNRQLYAIKNHADEFDISKAIPSDETVDNYFEADSFYGSAAVSTITSPQKDYSATYTYKWTEQKKTGSHIDLETGEEVDDYETVHKETSNTFSFTARCSYQVLTRAQLYALERVTVKNDAYSGNLLYTRDNTDWSVVTPDVRIYTSDGGYGQIPGMLGIAQIGESHYHLPSSSIVGNRTIHVGSRGEAYGRMAGDERDAKQNVYNASWARNDRFLVNVALRGTNVPYIFLQDTKVTGCIIPGFSDTSPAKTAYAYGGMGQTLSTTQAVRVNGTQSTLIPANTDNLDYPSGVQADYVNIVNTVNNFHTVFRAGRGIFPDGTTDDIYNHVIDTPGYGSNWNRQDVPVGDGYDIKVHTPVISPIMVTNNYGTPAYYPDEQLLDVDESALYQLKLDGTYMLKWNLDQWVSSKYPGELLPGYRENDTYCSKYDKYVERKMVKFPFDVYYDGVYYEKNTWIEANMPSDIDRKWSSGLSLEERNDFVSNNHWQMMPFYIPTYAREGSGQIEVRVYARNVEGRYEGSHGTKEE